MVDDEERQREIASGILTKLGYTVEAVSSGEEAVEYVKEHPVDLMVLDMVMPKGINGREDLRGNHKDSSKAEGHHSQWVCQNKRGGHCPGIRGGKIHKETVHPGKGRACS